MNASHTDDVERYIRANHAGVHFHGLMRAKLVHTSLDCSVLESHLVSMLETPVANNSVKWLLLQVWYMFFKMTPFCGNHFRYCAAFPLQTQLRKRQTQL